MTKEEIHKWTTLKTFNYNEIIQLCTNTMEFSLFYCLIGSAGAGKTTAFRHFCEKNKNVFYARLDATWEPKDLYIHLLRLCGIQDYGYDLKGKHLAEKVAKCLNERGKCLVIIDDSGRFKSSLYVEHFQCLRDLTQDSVGIILSGTQKFKKDFEKWVAKAKGIPELNDRIMDWIMLPNPSKAELISVASRNGINDPQELESLGVKCKSYRSLKNEVIKLRLKRSKSAAKDSSAIPQAKQEDVAI